jgi:hypothetical protein
VARTNHHRQRRPQQRTGAVRTRIDFIMAMPLECAARDFSKTVTSQRYPSRQRSKILEALGTLLLIVVAIGFAAFGVYCFYQSGYRKAWPDDASARGGYPHLQRRPVHQGAQGLTGFRRGYIRGSRPKHERGRSQGARHLDESSPGNVGSFAWRPHDGGE